MQIENPYVQYMYSYPHKTAYRSLKDMDLKTYLPGLIKQQNSLYFHVPFCQSKCGYCNLFSLTGQSQEMMEAYVAAMERQAVQIREELPEGVVFSDLTMGGGTPLILSEHLLEKLFAIAGDKLGFQEKDCPIVVETSPNQTTSSKLKLIKDHGVTRVSIGVQSFCQGELETLCRFHTVESARKALDLIKKTGFSCMNLDLIYGIPGQTKESLLYSLEQAVAYEPEELFVYPLYVKTGTGLCRQQVSRSQEAYQMYLMLREKLREKGYQPYSMRRFVRTKAENPVEKSLEEMPELLCGFGNTLSLGCGGRSYIDNLHFCTPYAVRQENCNRILKAYLEKEDYMQIEFGYLLNPEEERRRYLMKHILFGTGIWLEEYQKRFGTETEKDFPLLLDWIEQGYAVRKENRIVLNDTGFSLSDYLGPQLISDEVAERMRNWRE